MGHRIVWSSTTNILASRMNLFVLKMLQYYRYINYTEFKLFNKSVIVTDLEEWQFLLKVQQLSWRESHLPIS